MGAYRARFKFCMLVHCILFLSIIGNVIYSVSLKEHIMNSLSANDKLKPLNYCYLKTNINEIENRIFTKHLILYLGVVVIATLLSILLLTAGDIHPNPGPSSSLSSSSNDSHASSLTSILSNSHHLSFIHYNVQSVRSKIDILSAELSDFDILSFTETWLHPNIKTDDLHIQSFQNPERKDRIEDPHGGVMVYVKDNLNYMRRLDIELPGIECLWIEIILKHKRILFGVFYRPPNSDSIYHSLIEDSIHLAIDTGIRDIVVTGDFNYNMFNDTAKLKILNLCQEFSMYQCITEPTHYTENSVSLLDIVLVTNSDSVIFSGTGDPFLNQENRYHCPVYGVLNFTKPKTKVIERNICLYEQGNYELLREKAARTNWIDLRHYDVNVHASNITEHILEISKQCIPNRIIKIKPSDPPWITTAIKRLIRKRKRLFRKAKNTDDLVIWRKFRRCRNDVINQIRVSKQSYIDKMTEKLKSDKLTSKDWWRTLKYFISPNKASGIPSIQVNNSIITDEIEKANLLNNYFRDQTMAEENIRYCIQG